jgi:xanthine/uracil permease
MTAVITGAVMLVLGFGLGFWFAGWWANRDFHKRFPMSYDHTDTTLE